MHWLPVSIGSPTKLSVALNAPDAFLTFSISQTSAFFVMDLFMLHHLKFSAIKQYVVNC